MLSSSGPGGAVNPGRPTYGSTVTRTEARSVVAVEGDLDIATAPHWEATVRGELAERPVLLDLRLLAFIDSSGSRALAALLRDVAGQEGRLAVIDDLRTNIRRVLEITGVLGRLPLQPAESL